MLGNDNSVAQSSKLTCSEAGRYENNPAKEGDVITDPANPGVDVTNGHIDVYTVEDVTDWLVGQDICPTCEVIGTPHVDCEAGVYRLILVEDGAERGERGPLSSENLIRYCRQTRIPIAIEWYNQRHGTSFRFDGRPVDASCASTGRTWFT